MSTIRNLPLLVLIAVSLVLAACNDDSASGEDVTLVDTDMADGTGDTVLPDGADVPPDEDMPPVDMDMTMDGIDGDMTDPCVGVSTCAMEDAQCDGDSLVVCAPNANGCLVEETTDCAATTGGSCDDTGNVPVCTVDPCSGLPNACQTEGRSCDGDLLLDCAPNAFGCLVETATDCTTNMGACDDSGMTTVCTNGPACDTLPNACDTAGTTCNGPSLVTCAPDAFGCLVETTEDCSMTPNGFCDSNATPNVCDVSTVDPCDGVMQCSPEGRSCSGDTLSICAPDAFGCLVEATTDCTMNGEICDDSGMMAVCAMPCMDECSVDGELTCDGSTLTLCSDSDMNGCLDITTTDCAANNEYCDGAAMPPACVMQGSGDTCADPIVVQGSGARFTGADFGADFADDQDFNSGGGCDAANVGNDAIFQVDLLAGETLVVNENGDANTIRRVVSSCSDGAACLESVDPDGQELTYGATADETVFVIVEDEFGFGGANGYDIDIEIVQPVCGDGFVSPTEACDDGNTVSMDGCLGDCSGVEMGFECVPGLCFPAGSGEDCATPIPLSGSTTFTGSTSTFGDDYSSYSGCNVGGGVGADTVFSVELQPGEVLNAQLLFWDFNAAIAIATDCMDITGTCQDIDGTAQNGAQVEYENTSMNPETVFVIVDSANNFQPDDGNYTLDVVVRTPACGDGFIDGMEECDDGNTDANDGCSPMCTIEGEICNTAIQLSGSTTVQGDTTPYFDDYGPYGGACGNLDGDGPDVVYTIDVPAGDLLVTTMEFANARETLALVTDCANISGSCLAADNTLPDPRVAQWQNDTGMSQTVFIIADGVTGGSDGPFTLTVDLVTPVCGNGLLEGEECDDGNTMDMDGCSAMCTIEMGNDCFGEPSFCFAETAGDTCAMNDAIALPGAGLYGGDTSNKNDDYSGYDGAGCPGSIFSPASGNGEDMVYTVVVPAGQTLDVIADPEQGFDVTLALLSSASMDCATINAMTCLDADDNSGPGTPESLSYTNTSNADETVFIIVDGFNGSDGIFDLDIQLN